MNSVTQTPTREVQGARREPTLLPPVDVIEDASGITLYADLPGVPRDKLHLRVEGDFAIRVAPLDRPRPAHGRVTDAADQSLEPVRRQRLHGSLAPELAGRRVPIARPIRVPRQPHGHCHQAGQRQHADADHLQAHPGDEDEKAAFHGDPPTAATRNSGHWDDRTAGLLQRNNNIQTSDITEKKSHSSAPELCAAS